MESIKSDKPTTLTDGSVINITETAGYDDRATKKLLRRLDWHIIPFMSLIYLFVPCLRTLIKVYTVLTQPQALFLGPHKYW